MGRAWEREVQGTQAADPAGLSGVAEPEQCSAVHIFQVRAGDMAAAFRRVDLLPSQMLVKFCRNHDRFSIPLRCKEMAAARRVQTTRRFTAGIDKDRISPVSIHKGNESCKGTALASHERTSNPPYFHYAHFFGDFARECCKYFVNCRSGGMLRIDR